MRAALEPDANASMMPRAVLQKLAAVALLTACCGCSGIEGDFDAAPLLRHQQHPAAGVTEADAFGPFIPYKSDGTTTKYGLRPFFVREERPWQDRTTGEREVVTSILAPFAKYHKNPRTTQFRFWPLFWITSERPQGGGEDFDWMLFPILFYGNQQPAPDALGIGERPGRYFAIFPLAGKIDNFVAYDSFQFLAWPILQRLTKRVFPNEPEEAFHSIALLAGWTTGWPRGGSWHVLPFYSRSVWNYPPHTAPKYPEGADPTAPLPRYIKEIYLWPFVHKQTLDMDLGPGKETKLFSVWPFFKRETAYDHEFTTFLWPFFRWNYEYPEKRESYETKIENSDDPIEQEAAAEEEPNVLVDFMSQAIWRYQKTKDYLRRRLLLIVYAEYQTLPENKPDRVDSWAVLQPIGYWNRSIVETHPDGSGFEDKQHFALVPFFQTHERRYRTDGAADGRTDRFTRLWPLFSYERNADGSRDVHAFTLLPLRIEKYTKDFLDAWGAFVNVYRYRRAPDAAGGATEHTALFNLIKYYGDAAESSWSIPLLWTSRTIAGENATEFTRRTLLGMFGWEGVDRSDGSAERTLRLFWIPIRMGGS